MKKVTRILGLCALVALATVSCKKDDNNAPQGSKSFRATINQPTDGAKTHIDGDNYLVWNDGDAINVYAAEGGDPSVFTTNSGNAKVATFTGDIDESAVYYACYPKENTIAEGEATLSLTNAQTYATEGLISNGVYPMAAVNDGKNFEFHSPCGVLHLALKGTATVGSIVLTDETNDIAGDITVAVNAPTTVKGIANGQKTITLTCNDGVALNGTPKDFYIVAAAGAFAQGFTAVVKDMDGNTIHELKTTENNELQAEHILTMPDVTIDYDAPTVTTVAATDVLAGSAVLNAKDATAPTSFDLAACGFEWGTDPTSLTNNVPATKGATFSKLIDDLEPVKTYYFRAYATATNGKTGYGEILSFTTPAHFVGNFSVSDELQVTFAPGNLYYDGNKWGFEDEQQKCRGGQDKNNCGMFHWSGTENTFGLIDYDAKDGNFIDWGTLAIYNPETKTTDAANTWRTLSKDEVEYLCYTRTNAANLRGIKWINSRKCVIFMPDGWTGSIADSSWESLRDQGGFAMPMCGSVNWAEGEYNPWGDNKQLSWWTSTLETGDNGMSWNFYYHDNMDGWANGPHFAPASHYHMFTVRLAKDVPTSK